MKLYLISDDIIVRQRWAKALTEFSPVVVETFGAVTPIPSIIFVLDRMIGALNDTELKNLFSHRVMILSMVPNFQDAQRLLKMGAMGYGNAMMHISHLHSAYQALEEGKVWLHPDFITLMITQIRDTATAQEKSAALLDGLSKREQEVALMLGNGSTHQQIADALDITVRTVKAHATSIYQKLDVKDRLALSLLLHT